MGNILDQRDALELEDWALQIKYSKKSCNPLLIGIPLSHLPILPFQNTIQDTLKNQADDKYTRSVYLLGKLQPLLL